jgi:Phosphotransferase enzyme family
MSGLAAVTPLAQPVPKALLPFFENLMESEDFVAVVLGASKDPNPKVTVALLAPGSVRPSFVIKAPMTDAAEAAVSREKNVIQSLWSRFGQLPGTPRVLPSVDFQGRQAMVVSGLQGTPMFTSYHRRRHTTRPKLVAADFTAVQGWLESFQLQTLGPRVPVTVVSGMQEQLENRFRDDEQLAPTVEILSKLNARLGQHSVPQAAVHGDLWCGNVLVADRRVSGVVDWELGAGEGNPLRDLGRFAITYALYLDRHTKSSKSVSGHPGLRADGWGAGVRYAVEGDGWFCGLFRSFIRSGLVRLGAPNLDWRDVVQAGLLEIAVTADDLAFARHHLELFLELDDSTRKRRS